MSPRTVDARQHVARGEGASIVPRDTREAGGAKPASNPALPFRPQFFPQTVAGVMKVELPVIVECSDDLAYSLNAVPLKPRGFVPREVLVFRGSEWLWAWRLDPDAFRSA